MKFIAICESDFPITEEVEEELKNTLFVGNEDCTYCFEITKIINDEVISELKGEDKLTCDRNICLRNEYNNIGCEDCVVMKGENK